MKFNQIGRYVERRLRNLRIQRKDDEAFGLHRLRGTAPYPETPF